MYTFKLLFSPSVMVLSASALLQIDQATSSDYGNHTLAPLVKSDRSTPPLLPSQVQFPHTRFVRHDPTDITRSSQSTSPTATAVIPTAWADRSYSMVDPRSRPPNYRDYSRSNAPSWYSYTLHHLRDTLEGVRCGKECHRGHDVELEAEDAKLEVGSAIECNLVCPYTGECVCGGGYQMKAIAYGDTLAALGLGPTGGTTTGSTSALTIPAVWMTGPCMIDQASPRLLSNRISSLTSNTPASCQSQCMASGYQIAGVQYSRECWCGNALSFGGGQTPASQVVNDSECAMNCPGSEEDTCGNPWRTKVYGLGSVLSQYNLSRFTTSNVAASGLTRNAIRSQAETLASASVTTTGSSSRTLPAKRVIAHHMVGNTYPYTLDTWSTDISLALSAGIDGFVLNVGNGGLGSWQRAQVKNAYNAAAALSASGNTFGLFLSLDMT